MKGGMAKAELSSAALLGRMKAAISEGRIRPDAGQLRVAERLADLSQRLAHYRPSQNRHGLFSRLFSLRECSLEVPRGLYIWGEPGRGKTMLMDLFFETAPVPAENRRRVHFHAFMQDVHKRIHDIRAKQAAGMIWEDADPVAEVARILFQDAWLLCFDEFQVTDITDAMILGRLFKHLFSLGTVMVATSNMPPDALYADGLNRGLFEPFIANLCARCEVVALTGETDYRLCGPSGDEVWVAPLGPDADAAMDRMWFSAIGALKAQPLPVDLGGRVLMVPRAAGSAARFTFSDLCERPLGAADYLAIAARFHVVFVDHIPVLAPEQRNETMRFITLVDALYDRQVRLVASAAGQPGELYPEGPLKGLFARTVSRLEEMRRTGWPPVMAREKE